VNDRCRVMCHRGDARWLLKVLHQVTAVLLHG